MHGIGKEFRDFVLAQEIEGCAIAQVDDEHIEITGEGAVAAVNFYCFDDMPEVVELRIADANDAEDVRFFLHFELEDLARAKELFAEMAEALREQEHFDTRRVLLCCTAGLTTTMFAAKLQEAADTLSLDYEFMAMPLAQAKTEGASFDAILLAPQVGYQRAEVAAAFPAVPVVPVPAKIFAAYDAGAALKLVMHLLSDNTVFPSDDGSSLRLARDMKNDYRIMVIAVVGRPKNTWMGWRVYDRGEVTAFGSVVKAKHDLRDVEDLLGSVHLQGVDVSKLDAVGIAVPGVVNRGSVADRGEDRQVFDYELGRRLAKRYGTKVFVDNNANAAAVGCYVSQDEYDSVVLHTQQTGYPIGGQGIVVDGHLLKGRKNYAGELGALFAAVHSAPLLGSEHVSRLKESARDGGMGERTKELPWSPEGMRALVAPILAADVSLLAPDAIYVAVDLLDDMGALREAMLPFFAGQELYLPDLIHVTDYRARIALGELALCVQKLNAPRPHRKH